MTGSCLYLVSSSASRDYVTACVEALALPRGMIQHFRYRLEHIDERLRKSLRREAADLPPDLRNLPVVVVYLYQVQSGGKWRPWEQTDTEKAYLPLRCGKLIHAFRDGEIAHFYFEVGDYAKPRYQRLSAPKLLKTEGIRFQTAAAKDARQSYAHLAKDLRLGAPRANDTVAFHRFVDHAYRPSEWRTRSLGSAPLDVTYDVIFYRVSGLFDERNDRLRPLRPIRRALWGNIVSEYELQAGSVYHIRVNAHLYARSPAELPGQGSARLRLHFDPKVFRSVGPTSFAISSLYYLEYWSILADCAQSQHSLLTISCEHNLAPDRENFARRELLCLDVSLPVSVVCSSSKRGPARDENKKIEFEIADNSPLRHIAPDDATRTGTLNKDR